MKINVLEKIDGILKPITREMTQQEIDSMPIPNKIDELKQLLAETDYIACKIAEGVATKEEYADIIAQRQAWRNEINELEKQEAVTV